MLVIISHAAIVALLPVPEVLVRMTWILLLDFLFFIHHLNFQGVFLTVRGIAPAGAVILLKTVSMFLFRLIAVD